MGPRGFGLASELRWEYSTQAFSKENQTMLETVIVILVVLWLLGLLTAYTAGGLIHLLLVIALVVLVIRVVQGRRIL